MEETSKTGIDYKIYTCAKKHGFAGMLILKLQQLDEWHKYSSLYGTDSGMPYDLVSAYPGASCAVLLIWAYNPYKNGERLSPYYAASNMAYHAAKAVESELKNEGLCIERCFLPARALCLANGVGYQGKNGLLSIYPFGTRMVLETMVLYSPAEEIRFTVPKTEPICPEGCTACINACPMGAITESGLNVRRCMRYIMNSGYTDEIRLKQQMFLGCEVCQSVCPRNAHLKHIEPGADMMRAFDLKQLIEGDTKAARLIAGKNITGRGRLTMEAIAFAAREGLYENEIRACLSSPIDPVREAAEWAVNQYFGGI